MQWIYLSPHIDDAVLSCGGAIWQQAQAGDDVAIWTIYAGDPPAGPLSEYALSLHARWRYGVDAVARRRSEDKAACHVVGAAFRHFQFLDCIYRRSPQDGRALYASEAGLFGALQVEDDALVEEISRLLVAELPVSACVTCPLTLGNHVDHRVVRMAVERIRKELWYYSDFPYVIESAPDTDSLIGPGWEEVAQPASSEGLAVWQDAVACYRSQISTFWLDEADMRRVVADYYGKGGGGNLWHRYS